MIHSHLKTMIKQVLSLAIIALALSCAAQQKASDNSHTIDMNVVKPESVGFFPSALSTCINT